MRLGKTRDIKYCPIFLIQIVKSCIIVNSSLIDKIRECFLNASRKQFDKLNMASVPRDADNATEFQHCYQKLMVFVFKEDERTRSNLNVLIDELIALDYSSLRMINEVWQFG